MAIDFNLERWESVKENAQKWWAGELDRPLIQIRLKGQNPNRDKPKFPFYEFTSFYDLTIPAEVVIDCIDYELSCTKFLGDAFPDFRPNFGPGVIAAFMGAQLENGLETVWFHPENEVPIEQLNFEFKKENVWFTRIKSIIIACQKRWGKLVQIGLTDLGGSLDILSSFRPGEKLLLDLYDHPKEVKRLIWQAHESWWQYFEEFQTIYKPFNQGFSSWAPIFSEDSFYMLQCDFCYMISPAMFEKFVKPELDATAKKLKNAFYHLDGIGQLPHLDSLLKMENIKGIQWVPGDGQPGVEHWPEVYQKIYNSGKMTQIYNVQCAKEHWFTLLDILEEQVGCVKNVVYMVEADISQENEARKLLEKYGVES